MARKFQWDKVPKDSLTIVHKACAVPQKAWSMWHLGEGPSEAAFVPVCLDLRPKTKSTHTQMWPVEMQRACLSFGLHTDFFKLGLFTFLKT